MGRVIYILSAMVRFYKMSLLDMHNSYFDSTETSSMTCKVKKATNCDAKVAKKCKHIHYTETVIKPVSKCVPFYVYVPFQERHHKKKCVFGDHKDGHDLGHYSGGKHH